MRTENAKQRILLVDDEPAFTGLLRLNLESLGRYEVWEVNDPREAVPVAREFLPDLILLDISMSDPDGSALAAQLRNDPDLKQVPILFLTGLVSREEVRPRAWGMGRCVYLPKPVQWKRLLAWIDAAPTARPEMVAS